MLLLFDLTIVSGREARSRPPLVRESHPQPSRLERLRTGFVYRGLAALVTVMFGAGSLAGTLSMFQWLDGILPAPTFSTATTSSASLRAETFIVRNVGRLPMKDVKLTCGLIEARFRMLGGGWLYKPDPSQIGMLNAANGTTTVASIPGQHSNRFICNVAKLAGVDGRPMTNAEIVVGVSYKEVTNFGPQKRSLSAPFLCGVDSVGCEEGDYPIRTDADPTMSGVWHTLELRARCAGGQLCPGF